jgi:aconitate hydratase
LGIFGDSLTTDHISPAGSIKEDSPAGAYLKSKGIEPADFNSYGARRGNHEIMMRGTFANIRIRNLMLPDKQGGFTRHQPSGDVLSIYDAAMRYMADGVPLVVIGGREYGTGSSRDWAAKGPLLLGVRAVIAESFERIHRTNLVCMGVLPLQFEDGVSARSLRLSGEETFTIGGLASLDQPGQACDLEIMRPDGSTQTARTISRIDTENEVTYFKNGGILNYVLRDLTG